MEHRNEFTEEMLRQMYQRRGYQVMRLCGEVTEDRSKVMELTFQAFGEAHRQLSATEGTITTELQDAVLLECTRRILHSAMPAAEQPVTVQQPAEDYAEFEEPSPIAEEQPMEEIPQPEEDILPVFEEAEPQEAAAPAEEAEDSRTMVEKFNDMKLEEEPVDLTDTSGSNFGWGLLVLVLILVVLALLWAIWGVAQTIFPIPQLDLGYQWFNANIYPLF